MADTFRRDNHPLVTLLIAVFIIAVLLLPATRNGCGPHEDYYHFSYNAFGCDVNGQINVWDRSNRVSPVTVIESKLDSMVVMLDATVENSGIAQLNRCEINKDFTIPAQLAEVLRIAQGFSSISDGIFFFPDGVTLDSANRKFSRSNASAMINLEELQCGYSVDKTIKTLREYGTSGALLNVGGNYFALGRPEKNRKWHIDVHDPQSNAVVATLKLVNKACTIDKNVAVIGRNATTTDAVASIICKLPDDQVFEFLKEYYPGIDALLITDNGTLKMTDGVEQYLVTNKID
ncbi:hypothetical protein HN843_06675 [bacterium]|jgi:thiamine biosynthesis lipoprotein ApbE|nr:hypothetical protein [bacterium]